MFATQTKKLSGIWTCADPESFNRGVQHWQRFFSWRDGMRIEKPLKVGNHRPASKTPMAFRRRADNGLSDWMWLNSFVILGDPDQYCSILLGNPIFLWFFRGSGPLPPSPSGSAHAGLFPVFSSKSKSVWLVDKSREISYLNLLILKKQRNLKLSSAENYKWCFMG